MVRFRPDRRAGERVSSALQRALAASKPALVQLGMTAGVLLYMVLGAFVFMWIEAKPPRDFGAQGNRSDGSTLELLASAHDCVFASTGAGANGSVVPPAKSWTFANSLMFTYTVMTTIGYGNIAPVTIAGRVFCIVYGIVGIPLTMMGIANIGKFFSDVGKHAGVTTSRLLRRWRRRRRRRRRRAQSTVLSNAASVADANSRVLVVEPATVLANEFARHVRAAGEPDADSIQLDMQLQPMRQDSRQSAGELGDVEADVDSTADEEEVDDELSTELQTVIIVGCFGLYVALGAAVIPLYEEDMDFFSAIYFNFVTLTTVGLGDIIPNRADFMWFTLAYITAGLALTTVAIEVASDHLQRLHYVGRKLRNAGNVAIWFGGQKLTVKSLMQNVGETYGIKELEDPDISAAFINNIVDAAIKRDEDPNFELPKFYDDNPFSFIDTSESVGLVALQPLKCSRPKESVRSVREFVERCQLGAALVLSQPLPDEKHCCDLQPTREIFEPLIFDCDFDIEIVRSMDYERYASARSIGKEIILKPATAETVVELVPVLFTSSLSPDAFTREHASTSLHGSPAPLQPAVVPQCNAVPALLVTDVRAGVVCEQQLATPSPERSPSPTPTTPAKQKTPRYKVPPKPEKPKVDPKKRYELYQKQWAKYNATFLEAKKYEDVKKNEGVSKNPSPSHSGTSTPASRSRANSAVRVPAHSAAPLRKKRTDDSISSSSSTTSGRGGVQSPQNMLSIARPTAASAAAAKKSPVAKTRSADRRQPRAPNSDKQRAGRADGRKT